MRLNKIGAVDRFNQFVDLRFFKTSQNVVMTLGTGQNQAIAVVLAGVQLL